jgi:hypothetical protein
MKWMLWNDGVEMAEFGMTRVRIGLFQHALAYPEANSERFESIEAKLEELRSYLYANRESVRGYVEAYRNGERVSTAHVESNVNQLINWRMCKKHQMGRSRAGAQQLLHVKTAIINGRLDRYTGHHSVPADVAAWPPGFCRSLIKDIATRIVTNSRDDAGRLWDAESGKLLFTLEGHRGGVSSAHFSPDGKLIVTASGDKTVAAGVPRAWNRPISTGVNAGTIGLIVTRTETPGILGTLIGTYSMKQPPVKYLDNDSWSKR